MTAMETSGSPAQAHSELTGVLDSLHDSRCVYFPLRHHSPASAWHLARLICNLKPSSVLIEGPASFTPFIPALLDPATKPPVALYTHFIDVDQKLFPPVEGGPSVGPARFAAYYPFCEYSPELIALRRGQEAGAKLRFIDLDYADQVMARRLEGETLTKPRIETLLRETHLQRSGYLRALAERSGCRDFNEMWDHLFEADFEKRSTESFMSEVATYCFFARNDAAPEALEFDGTSARERAMAAAIDEELAAAAAGSGPILVVTGGFHTVVLPRLVGQGHKSRAAIRRPAGAVQQALIRYSFEQLDALNGYAAGMPSPSYYDRLWAELGHGSSDAHSKVAAAVLVEVGALTRNKDMQVALSAADEIAALEQAELLASLRGHPGPTREDLLDGVRSCFVKGAMDAEGRVLMGLVAHVLRGSAIGEVPATAGVPPIVASFRKEAEIARLDIRDSTRKRIALEIYRQVSHRRTSRFLHSVSFLGVPFAGLVGGPDFVRGTAVDRLHEHWQYAWSPMTEGALVSAAVYGATLEEASSNRLREAIARLDEEGKGRNATAAVAMLVHACRMGLHRHAPELVALIAARIGEEPAFVGAIQAANQLLMLWQSREPLEAHSLTEVPQLLQAAYLRACYLAPGLAACPEEEVGTVLDCLASVRELLAAAGVELLDPELFWDAAGRILAIPSQAHAPYCTIAGAVAGLLFSAGRMTQPALNELVTGYLVGIADSERRVGFLRGLVRTCREAAWQNIHLIQSLDEIIAAWGEAEFLSALPNLRLAFAELTPRETDKVAALVASLHGKAGLGGLVQTHATEGELELNRRLTALVLESLENDGLGHWSKGAADE